MVARSWTAEQDRILVAAVGGRDRVTSKEMEGVVPGKTGEQCRHHWRNVKARATQRPDGTWTLPPVDPARRTSKQVPKQTVAKLRAIARAAIAGDMEAICSCAMLGVDMRARLVR